MRVAMEIDFEGKRGKSKKSWLDRIENDMKIASLNIEGQNIILWRAMVTDPII